MASALFIQLLVGAAIISIASAVGLYQQCAGEGYATYPCDAGLACYRRNRWFSSCQYSCPLNLGWECENYVVKPPVSGVVANWDQCGADGWVGPRVCGPGYACYARSIHYSQCRPIGDCPLDWACRAVFATTPAPVVTAAPTAGPFVLGAYAQCNNVANSVCVSGTACFRFNGGYAECRPFCPSGWGCETDVAIAGQQCGGEGYVGLTRCDEGLRCYVRSKWYSQCAASCPGAEWVC